MTCLLCDTPVHQKESFTSLLFQFQKKNYICEDCWSRFERIDNLHCSSCYKSGVEGICQDCLCWQKQGHEIHHQALFTYNEMMKQYFSSYKFQGDYLLRKIFSNEIKRALADYKSYTIVPIPLSEESLKKRKFNQVTGFLEDASISYQRLLEVQGKSKPTQSNKTRKERMQTKQFFQVANKEILPERILLVDDIYTTGATLILAKQVLYEKGVKTIKTFSLAR